MCMLTAVESHLRAVELVPLSVVQSIAHIVHHNSGGRLGEVGLVTRGNGLEADTLTEERDRE